MGAWECVCVGGEGGGVLGETISNAELLPQNDFCINFYFCIKVGSDLIHFEFSLIARVRFTRWCSQITICKERRKTTQGIDPQLSSVQDGIYALGKAHMRSAPSLKKFPQRRL